MRRWGLLGLLLVAGALLLYAARAYTPELVHHVVYKAFLRKAPPDFATEEVQRVFRRSFERSQTERQAQRRHLDEMFAISQLLEKKARLTRAEAAAILQRLENQPD